MLKIVAEPFRVASPQHISAQLYLLQMYVASLAYIGVRSPDQKNARKPRVLHRYYGTSMDGHVCMFYDAPVRFQGKFFFCEEARRLAHFLLYLDGCMYTSVAYYVTVFFQGKNFPARKRGLLTHFLRYFNGCMYTSVAYYVPFFFQGKNISFARKLDALHTCYDTSMDGHDAT